MKIGVYLATHNNPMFLRFTMLQIINQTCLPHVVSIHENGDPRSYLWAIRDLLDTPEVRSMTVLHDHSPYKEPKPLWHSIPLGKAYMAGCDVFLKFDQDDFVYNNHIATMIKALEGYDCTLNTQADVMTLYPNKPYLAYRAQFTLNPTQGMSDSVCFNRAFANEYLQDMLNSPNEFDDVVLAYKTMPKFRVNRINQEPTTGFVMHMANTTAPCLQGEGVARELKGTEIPNVTV